MEALVLPPNFDKYNKIIEYFRNNGFDCLSTLQEQFRFYVRYIYHSRHQDFNRKSLGLTSLRIKWKRWCDPAIDSYEIIDINNLTFNVSNRGNFKPNKECLYEQLSNVNDKTILHYFNELYDYGELVDISVSKTISIGNKFNNATIKVKKENFIKHCGYAECIKEFKMNDFVIDIEFDDDVAKDISNLIDGIDSNKIKSIKKFEQKIAVIDFLQISYQYKIQAF